MLNTLAQRLQSSATWESLVVPPAQREALRTLATQVRQRGLGAAALFSGPGGDGKRSAAEVLARDLGRELYRVDLSRLLSKYIGETEKHLDQLFDDAEQSDAILLFDEADALFGRRTDVKDSHDRYANIEIDYLLQRMEAYAGLVILATNSSSAIDPAILRRFRFVVDFPVPDKPKR
jgi:SpoVK/Ycf46/Vps4 family AAA+-type ATPase